jgi:hypothetical protein
LRRRFDGAALSARAICGCVAIGFAASAFDHATGWSQALTLKTAPQQSENDSSPRNQTVFMNEFVGGLAQGMTDISCGSLAPFSYQSSLKIGDSLGTPDSRTSASKSPSCTPGITQRQLIFKRHNATPGNAVFVTIGKKSTETVS